MQSCKNIYGDFEHITYLSYTHIFKVTSSTRMNNFRTGNFVSWVTRAVYTLKSLIV